MLTLTLLIIRFTGRCPRCRASKDSFQAVTITIAGFSENQGYGFGGNEMTEGDKNLAIFGGLGAPVRGLQLVVAVVCVEEVGAVVHHLLEHPDL